MAKKEDIKIEDLEKMTEDIEEVKNIDEVKEQPSKEEPKKQYHGKLRGFKTYEDAVNYPNTEAFSKLDIGCQTEYKNWLKTIM